MGTGPVLLTRSPLALDRSSCSPAAQLWGWSPAEPFDASGARLTTIGLVCVVLVFLVGLTFPLKKFDRYLLPVYAPLDIIAGLGWYSLAVFLKSRAFKGLLRYSPLFLAAAVAGVQLAGSLKTFPYYLTLQPAHGWWQGSGGHAGRRGEGLTGALPPEPER
jgi:4-amino-4-deoxy-L-arabinose transferase-like glycosyltransferase